ncbi:MAG TPA: hypothetical protein VF311_14675 [Terriglobales bacterium]|jgi:hypothetical protein
MPRTRRWIALGLLLAAPVLLAQTPAQAPAQTTTPHRKSHKTQTQVVLPPLPRGPLSQLPMDQLPATPAKVSYQGGLLTISAQNSTLGEILRDVRKLTGASIEIPPGSGANERVVTHLGPGAPRDVLAGLLNGSSFNYVMLGSISDPTAISSVVLMAKPSSSGGTQTAANANQSNPAAAMPPNRFPPPQPFNQQFIVPQPGNGQPANAEGDDSAKDDEENADDNADDQAQTQPGQPGQPDMTGANVQDQQQQPDPNQPNAGPKTPEQILEMLRRPQPPGGAVMPPPQQPPQQ